MTGPKSAALNEIVHNMLQMEYFSRHPSGRPFFIETCEYARSWAIGQTDAGTGGYKVDTGMGIRLQGVSTDGPPYTVPYNGKSAWLLTSPGVNSGYLNLNHIMSIPHNLRLGFEIFFAFPYSSGVLHNRCNYFYFGFELHDVDNILHTARLRYKTPYERLELYTPAEYPEILDLSGNKEYGENQWIVWQNAKLIVDLEAGKYVKLFWNEDEVDLSDYAVRQEADTSAPRLSNKITIGDLSTAVQYYMFIGGIILTLEEP